MTMIEDILLAASFSVMTMFLWFDTNVFYEYLSRIPKIRRIFHAYEVNRKHYDNCRYSEFVMIYHSNFWSRLASCPYCFGFWISLGFSILFLPLLWIPLNYLLAVILYTAYSRGLEAMNGKLN
jgi:hypothetical protein